MHHLQKVSYLKWTNVILWYIGEISKLKLKYPGIVWPTLKIFYQLHISKKLYRNCIFIIHLFMKREYFFWNVVIVLKVPGAEPSKRDLPHGLKLIPDFVNEEEETLLLESVDWDSLDANLTEGDIIWRSLFFHSYIAKFILKDKTDKLHKHCRKAWLQQNWIKKRHLTIDVFPWISGNC